jgi:hypothetical protein
LSEAGEETQRGTQNFDENNFLKSNYLEDGAKAIKLMEE